MADIINNEKLILEARKRLTLTNVEAVNGFTENYLNLTVSGKPVRINGSKLKISSFNKATGNLICDGDISEIKFEIKKQSFFKRVLK